MIDQLSLLVKQVNAPDVDVNKNLIQLEEKRIEKKIMEKLNESITAQQVELGGITTELENILKEIIHLLQQLCDVLHLTQYILKKVEKY